MPPAAVTEAVPLLLPQVAIVDVGVKVVLDTRISTLSLTVNPQLLVIETV